MKKINKKNKFIGLAAASSLVLPAAMVISCGNSFSLGKDPRLTLEKKYEMKISSNMDLHWLSSSEVIKEIQIDKKLPAWRGDDKHSPDLFMFSNEKKSTPALLLLIKVSWLPKEFGNESEDKILLQKQGKNTYNVGPLTGFDVSFHDLEKSDVIIVLQAGNITEYNLIFSNENNDYGNKDPNGLFAFWSDKESNSITPK